MAITCKKITFDLLVKLGKKFGYIDFKGYTIQGMTECWVKWCDSDFEFKDEKELWNSIREFISDCRIQDQWADEQQMDSMYASM